MPRYGTCLHCGATFATQPSLVRSGKGKLCSAACSSAFRRRRLSCICRQCGGTFIVQASSVSYGRGQHCSRACARLSRCIPPDGEFWAKVDKHGPIPAHRPGLGRCWLWKMKRFAPFGYGTFVRLGKSYAAHRVSWEIAHGKPVPPGLNICHRCDTPPCVRPSHLFAGTQADNVADNIAKGRQQVGRGMAKQNAKLTDEDVREIRALHAAGLGTWTIARHFAVSPSTIYGIARGTSWRHVE